MKNLRNGLIKGLSLAVLGAGLAATPALPGAAAAPSPAGATAADQSLVRDMRADAAGDVSISRDASTGAVSFIRAEGRQGDLMPEVAGANRSSAASKAQAYLDEYAAAFGARPAELVQTGVSTDAMGTAVTFTQQYKGVDVFASRLKANFNQDGALTSVNGFAAPEIDLSVTPAKSAGDVESAALGWVRSDPPASEEGGADAKTDLSGIKATNTELVVYRMGAIKGEPGESVLAYTVEVTNAKNVREQLIFDANTAKLINRYSLIADALDRKLFEESPTSEPVWEEGDAFPGTLNDQQQNLVATTGESYWFYQNAFGRDSYDAAGTTMQTVNNDPSIDCPNANWNGVTTNYCDGVTSDDVVSHEWGHAYTEYTSGLIYQYQSGALNESYSDVWGETVDLINGRDDAGEDFQDKREVGACESTAPAGLEMSITAPEAVAGPCIAVEAAFGPGFSTTATTADVVPALDPADAAGPTTTDGCTAYDNAAEVAGNYAFVDRGTCGFQEKVAIAEGAGATGIVVGNDSVDYPVSMSGVADIPGVMVALDNVERFKSGTVSVSISTEDVSDRPDSTRWAIGEKSTAFGGAIRDMWSPTCYGDPGKVTDAEYKCDPTLGDAGGVHSNSGVPNHAYALMVDGGVDNGQTVAGMGLDKAAAVWFRAQTNYLTPSSNFTVAADALEASCTDLTGQPINQLTTQANATPVAADPITAADCADVTAAIAATEMRTPVAKCDFQPLLDPNAPSLCGEGFSTSEIYSEDFEDGLAGWTADQELADIPEFGYAGGFGAPWEASSAAPGDHSGGVAYGPAPDQGQCTGDGETDFSSADYITSPVITMPTGALNTPALSFEHYVATEGIYDGGNVQVALNEGDFAPIPAEAYTFNGPDELANLDAGNTNPLEGQPAFNGTDGGEVTGSWGTSLVDLTALEVAPGDTMQIRLAVGRDGCGGIDGWYLDNVTVSLCEKVTTPPVPDPDGVNKPYPTKTKAKTQKVAKFGANFKVRVKVKAKGDGNGIKPRGRVKIFTGGKRVGFGKLEKNGKVKVTIFKNLKRGKRALYVKFDGNKRFKDSRDSVQLRIF